MPGKLLQHPNSVSFVSKGLALKQKCFSQEWVCWDVTLKSHSSRCCRCPWQLVPGCRSHQDFPGVGLGLEGKPTARCQHEDLWEVMSVTHLGFGSQWVLTALAVVGRRDGEKLGRFQGQTKRYSIEKKLFILQIKFDICCAKSVLMLTLK